MKAQAGSASPFLPSKCHSEEAAPWNPAGGGAGRGGDSAVRPLSFPKAALGRRVTHSE